MLYNFETLRGGCKQLFEIAYQGIHLNEYFGTPRFTNFISIDWSKFDQLMPKWISKLFFTVFIPKLLLVNVPYHPTFEYPTHPSLDQDKTATTAASILSTLLTWFSNMTYVSTLGYSYRKTERGIPSGMFSTQFIDSFCNLYMIIDTLLDIDITEEEIHKLFIKVLGDDNIIFSTWNDNTMHTFITQLTQNAKRKYQMKINTEKSHNTYDVTQLEVLSYKIGKSGVATKQPAKQLAGLLFPEREFKIEFAAYRAIAFAITNLGNDSIFYNICKDYFTYYSQFAIKISTPEEKYQFIKELPQALTWLAEIRDEIRFDKFPTIEECKDFARYWKGPLGYNSKWRKSHFIYPPDFDFNKLQHIYGPTTTLFDYLKLRNLKIMNLDLSY